MHVIYGIDTASRTCWQQLLEQSRVQLLSALITDRGWYPTGLQHTSY